MLLPGHCLASLLTISFTQDDKLQPHRSELLIVPWAFMILLTHSVFTCCSISRVLLWPTLWASPLPHYPTPKSLPFLPPYPQLCSSLCSPLWTLNTLDSDYLPSSMEPKFLEGRDWVFIIVSSKRRTQGSDKWLWMTKCYRDIQKTSSLKSSIQWKQKRSKKMHIIIRSWAGLQHLSGNKFPCVLSVRGYRVSC